MGTGFNQHGVRCERCHGQPDRMARCTCTGQPAGAAAVGAAGVDDAIDAALATTATPPVSDPFEGWSPRPDLERACEQLLDQQRWRTDEATGTLGEGMAFQRRPLGIGAVSIVGVADLDPDKVDVLRRCGKLQLFYATNGRDGTDTLGPEIPWSSDADPSVEGAAAEEWIDRAVASGQDLASFEVLSDEFGALTRWAAGPDHNETIEAVDPGSFSTFASIDDAIRKIHPDVYWTAETGRSRGQFDLEHRDDFVADRQFISDRPGEVTGDYQVFAQQASTGDRIAYSVPADVVENLADHALVIDPDRDQMLKVVQRAKRVAV